ncbi:MAG: T9SS type A sorting domain-containing protein [Bacteroidales bacterium]|nr:T9SS type A sorting domain-containing protein [Bacteroidales bacterium]
MEQKLHRHWQVLPELKGIIILIAIIVFSTNILQSQCPQNIIFSTQAEIDAFPMNYPNCTEIEGIVAIDDGYDVTNLDGLSNIVSIDGILLIRNCPLLTKVDGLSSLSYVGMGIEINGCDILKNLNGLVNINYYDGFSIHTCDSLETLHGLENISSTPTFLKISFCQSLTELTSFPNLSFVEGNVHISHLPSLTNVLGLENLDSIAGAFFFGDNTSLTNVDGLEGLKSIGSDLQIYRNYSMENLLGLMGLQSIAWSLQINKCNSLTSLAGLDSLRYVGSNLLINENNSLQTLTGIDNIEAESIMNLSITYNPQLSTCEVQSVCDYLANPNGDIQIYVNAQGCNNSVEVEEACTVGIPEQRSKPTLSIYPNPFTTTTTIEYELSEPSHVQLIIYNAIGEMILVAEDRMMPQGMHTFIWTADRLPEGMYYAVLRSGEGVSVVKMVKQ